MRVATKDRKSTVQLSTFAVDESISNISSKFEEVLKDGDLKNYCDTKIAEASSEEEKSDWTVIETLISGSRSNLKEYLGFSEADSQANGNVNEPDTTSMQASEDDSDFFNKTDFEDSFLANIAASKGAKTNNPFEMYTGKESDSENKITRALLLGKFDQALDICLKEKKMSDAFMIAICGGEKCIQKAKSAYFNQVGEGPNYLRLLASISGKNLWDVVYNAQLKDWKDVMASICTYADEKDFPDLCEALGDRLLENDSRKDASFCFLAGSKLEKVLTIWLHEFEESESASMKEGSGDSSFFSIHAKALHDFMEKVTVFRKITEFSDDDHHKEGSWRLAPLYAKYVEYADILAAQGQLQIAGQYLDLLPAHYPAADNARNRIKEAISSNATQPTQPTQQKSTAQRGQRVISAFMGPSNGYPPQSGSTISPPQPAGVHASQPSAHVGQPNTFTPIGGPSAYTPAGSQQPSQLQGYQPSGSAYAPPSQPFQASTPYGQYTTPTGIAPPG